MSSGKTSNEAWGTRVGLILAMAGNAVGLGNFLRFPVQAASNGGGSFMITYFIALLLLGIPLMWIEWGIGRNGGRYRKGHIPGMFAAIWKHPAAKYVGVVGMVIPLVVMIYYTYIESWTLAFTWFSLTGDYWGRATQPEMAAYLASFQGVGDPAAAVHAPWTPYAFFVVTLAINIWIISKGISGGIEKLARIGMPILFIFAAVLAVVVLMLPAGPDGSTPATGLNFIYNPDMTRLGEPSVWLASAGQIFFTLSVGMGSLQAYASYLKRTDDIALNGIAYALPAAHRLRLSISTAYWPFAWPSPEVVTITVETGASSRLVLPVRPPRPSDDELRPFGEPEGSPPLAIQHLAEGYASRTVERDLASGASMLTYAYGNGRVVLPNGIELAERYRELFTLVEGDPLSAAVRTDASIELGRGDWKTRVDTESSMSCEHDSFTVVNRVEAHEGPRQVFARTWTKRIPRDLV